MSFISDALLKQLLESGMPVLIIPESLLKKEDDEEDDSVETIMKPRYMPSPS